MILTKEQAIENHRKMWNWIADEMEKQKRIVRKQEYFSANNISILFVPVWECYCCEYNAANLGIGCNKCPIQWKFGRCTWGEYGKWRTACRKENYKKAAKLARKIAKLPENKHIADGGR